MILRPLRFLWTQMNGPVIRGIFTALFRYLQTSFNTTLQYLTTFSISTANDKHLTFIGACMGMPRPIVGFASEAYFFFTARSEHNVDYGYSAEPGPNAVGGKFAGADIGGRRYELCPEVYYRTILQGYLNSESEMTSIDLIDAILYIMWQVARPNDEPSYKISFVEEATEAGAIGDIIIDLGQLSDWEDRDAAIQWQSVLTSVFNSIHNPNTYVSLEFTGD